MIAAVPLSLSHTNSEGHLPIQSAVWGNHSAGHVPLLAKEGILLVERANIRENVLQLLATLVKDNNPVSTDTAHLNTMMELRQSNLLLIQEYEFYQERAA